MKWDAIGAMGELVGAVAVVVSVLYLAWQVRSQVQETKLGPARRASLAVHGAAVLVAPVVAGCSLSVGHP